VKDVQHRTFDRHEVLEVVDIPNPKKFADFVLAST